MHHAKLFEGHRSSKLATPSPQLSTLNSIAYGAGDMAQNLLAPAVGMYLLFFYTEIYGLSPAVAAAMFLAVQIVDIVWNPIVGTFIDKHTPPWGKYRSYLILAGIPFAILSVLCFWNPFGDGGGAWKTIYAFATHTAFSLLFSLVNVAYGALSASLTRDANEMTILTAVRIFMANAACFAASAGIPLLVASLAGCSELPWRMALFMGLGILPSFIFMPLIPALRRRLGTKGLFHAAAPIAIVGMAALYILSRTGGPSLCPSGIYAAQFIKASGIVIATGYMWALVPEVVTYSELRTGRRISGIVNAIMGVFFRIGMAIGKIVPGAVLALVGYQDGRTNCESPLPNAPTAWLAAMSIFALLAIALLAFSFSRTKERIAMDAAATAKVKVSDLWREFARNPPLRILALFFVVLFAMMSIGNASGAYFMNGLEFQPPLTQEAIRWLVCIIPASLILIAAYLISRYPLSDKLMAEISRKLSAQT